MSLSFLELTNYLSTSEPLNLLLLILECSAPSKSGSFPHFFQVFLALLPKQITTLTHWINILCNPTPSVLLTFPPLDSSSLSRLCVYFLCHFIVFSFIVPGTLQMFSKCWLNKKKNTIVSISTWSAPALHFPVSHSHCGHMLSGSSPEIFHFLHTVNFLPSEPSTMSNPPCPQGTTFLLI